MKLKDTCSLEESEVKWSEVKVVQLCPTLCNPMDCTIHGILQARILEWVTFPFSKGSSQLRNWTRVSCIAGGFFTNWAIREAKNLTLLVCFLLPLNRDKKCLTLAAYFLHLETPSLPTCYPLIPSFSFRRIMFPRERDIVPKLVRQHILLSLILRVSDPRSPSSSWRKLPQWQEFEQPFVA